MNFERSRGHIALGVVFAIGIALVAGGRPGGGERFGPWPVLPVLSERTDGDEATMRVPGGALPLILGGFRGLAADFAWLRVQLAWERGDEPDVRRWSEVATVIDPEAVPFWLNGARMLAYDFADARWREAQARGGNEAIRSRIDAEQAGKALRFLDAGALRLPGEPRLWIEMGNIHLHRRGNPADAAACYARAVALPHHPLYAERILAGLLWRAGRMREGVDVLRGHLERLRGADSGEVDAELVEAITLRVSAWEKELEDILNK